MKKLVKPVEDFKRNEKAVETLCAELYWCAIFACYPSLSADSETENDILF